MRADTAVGRSIVGGAVLHHSPGGHLLEQPWRDGAASALAPVLEVPLGAHSSAGARGHGYGRLLMARA